MLRARASLAGGEDIANDAARVAMDGELYVSY